MATFKVTFTLDARPNKEFTRYIEAGSENTAKIMFMAAFCDLPQKLKVTPSDSDVNGYIVIPSSRAIW